MRVFQQADRLKGLTSAIFTQVDTLRKQAIAQGQDVITLSLGSPDLAPAPHIVAAMKQALDQDSSYGYTLSKGSADFLNAVTGWYARKFNVKLDPATEVHSLMGSQDGLAHIGLCLVNPGDVVLVPDPGYPIFFAGPLVAGAEIVTMPLKPENGPSVTLTVSSTTYGMSMLSSISVSSHEPSIRLISDCGTGEGLSKPPRKPKTFGMKRSV